METADPVETLYNKARAAGVPMAAVCREAGIAQTTPSRWRNGRNTPNYTTITKLDAALRRVIGVRAKRSKAAR